MNPSNALIGHTGFVGGNILDQHPFEFLYNSKNIEEIRGKNFDTVACAGVPAVKWLANKEPGNDLAGITRLMNSLKKISARKFILISTVDVYPATTDTDEDFIINKDELQPYGKNRRILEEFVEDNFNSLIVRLPALFGQGLKKNPLYDLMHGDFKYINPNSILQFYCLDYLWMDIKRSLENNLKIVNFVTEPLFLKEVAKEILNLNLTNETAGRPQHYDIHTKYGYLWGNATPYLYLKDKVSADLKSFATRFSI